MALPLPVPDRQIEANAALIASEVCAHPLAPHLPLAALDLAVGVTVGGIRVDAHTVRMLRLTLAHIDALEIAASLEVAA